MNMINIDGYTIQFTGWFGDYENCALGFIVHSPNGQTKKQLRTVTASKKGIARASIFGIKLKVNLVDNSISPA